MKAMGGREGGMERELDTWSGERRSDQAGEGVASGLVKPKVKPSWGKTPQKIVAEIDK